MTEAAQVADARIVVVPATPDRWADVVTILGGNGDRGCWCQAPRGRAVGYGKTPMFEKVGFRSLLETAAHSDRRPRWLYRLDFEEAGSPGA